jgi:gluconate 5-dehydrogenase
MCVEWGRHNIQINAIAPGYIVTNMTDELRRDASFSGWLTDRAPAGRWGTVKDVVGPVTWLCSGQSDFVNGQIIYVDGGLTAAI